MLLSNWDSSFVFKTSPVQKLARFLAQIESFPRKNVTPVKTGAGSQPIFPRDARPPKRAGFRLALRLAGMTVSGGRRNVRHSRESGNPVGLDDSLDSRFRGND